ncbi:class I SAM-dependent methyltransferase [Bradyrhizobium sp. SSUT18]|uniref:class I SAM-dependent methyltransferase n=1 Tax=Bradyrhizobium sp. SSUT18 TaxID=3040602 RepID=UPI002447DA10|nr:class I SAM-dependent methyltransferase [Bradyrhizobium sp. SSUT18]MDH2402759.1 class I SAM-dependent methyltransferase [Bradyrhizobium sp. SSUT18]
MIAVTDIYRGAATYYARHALPYPEDLFYSLVRVCSLSNSSRALDLGAGTGQIAIPLARLVADVLFVDPSDEMVEKGRQMAEAVGVKNIEFSVSRSEDLNEPMSSFDIATIAASFLWMEQSTVLAKLAQMLKPDGCIAIMYRERDCSEPGEWYRAMLSDIQEFWGGGFPAGPGAVRPVQLPYRQVLRASNFGEITELRHYYEHHWNIDDLLGYLCSTSLAAPGTLGPRRDEFTSRIRRLLLSYSPSGFFAERGHITTWLGFRP